MGMGNWWFLLFLMIIPGIIIYLLHIKGSGIGIPDKWGIRESGTERFVKYGTSGFLLVSLFLMIVSMGRPRYGKKVQEVEKKGIDIVITLDISGSMRAEDFRPSNRLVVAKNVAKDFIGKRKGDRIGMVVFADGSLIQCPLTSDRNIAYQLIDKAYIGMLGDATAVGMGLATSLFLLKDSKSISKVVILITDGRNNTGEIDPLSAAKIAKEMGIKVYTIGIGKQGPVPYPVQSSFGKRYVMARFDLDEKTLMEIADTTGGMYFRATTPDMLRKVLAEIDKFEPTTYKEHIYILYSEKYNLALIPAIIFLIISLLLDATFLRRSG